MCKFEVGIFSGVFEVSEFGFDIDFQLRATIFVLAINVETEFNNPKNLYLP